uniref:reverse transcriptase domain-containing protein n=1 Tax=Acinetobacter baumannii TaxID=470 RepID=UPI0033934ECA
NYRPGTLLPIISKVMERIVAESILRHFEAQRLMSPAQHGFRKHHSCLSNLLLTLDDWTQVLDDKGCIHACYLDISKAFGRVDHHLLLMKLQGFGLTGKLLDWLNYYLSHSKVRVREGGTLSREIEVTSGVSQCSVLGPLLFLHT